MQQRGGEEGQGEGQFEDGTAPPPAEMGDGGPDHMQTTEIDNERHMMEQGNAQEVVPQGGMGRRGEGEIP